MVAEYEASGLSRLEFCRSHRLSLATLTRYQKWKREVAGEISPRHQWVSVELAGTASGFGGWAGSGLAISLAAGRRIEVGRGFDGQTLAELLGVLDRL